MTDLKKWFPFKFSRSEKKAAETQGQGQGQAPAAATTAPVPAGRTPSLMSSVSPEMGRFMERVFSDPFFSRSFAPVSLFGEMDRFFGDFSPSTFSPSMDLVDEGSHIKVTAELPGLDKEDIELSVHEGTLTLRGEKKHEETKDEEGCYRTERYFGAFRRSIPLPMDVDLEKAEAKFEKGVLTVRFPKLAGAAEPQRKIPVS
jgi:HSP20 family protein